jgi:5'-nucleotidase
MALLAMLLVSACKPKEQKLFIVSTNDMHANIDNFPQMAALIDSLRTVHPDLLLFGAGDNRSGNPINDRYTEPAKPMYELMNAVGFDLSCFGNHEWDGGVLALRDVLTWAKFPFVCANVTFDDTLKMPNVYPYRIIERNGLKIGVIGGIQLGENGLPDFHPKNAGGSDFVPLDEVLPKYIEELKDCNAIFLLSHCGFEEDMETAAKFPQLEAIFGGHSHTRVTEKQLVGNVMVTQAEAKVKFVTLSTFTFRKGKIIDKDMQLLSVKEFPKKNEKIAEMVKQYNSDPYFSTVIATNLKPIESAESLGCLMTDAVRLTTGADMAFQNPGGVRFDTLSVRPVTIKDIFTLDPFNNEIIHFTLTGEEIIRLLKSCFVTDHGPAFCSGCSYSFKVDDNGEMTDIQVTLENGKPLDMNAKYSVSMNSYMSSVFDYEHEDEGQTTFRTSNELLLEYLGQHPEIDYSTVARLKEE